MKENYTVDKKEVKMGNSADLHDQDEWSWSESNDQWVGTVERQEKNREKKRKLRKCQKLR